MAYRANPTLPFTPEEIARIGLDSFRFSQGRPSLHTQIIKFLVATSPQRFTREAIEASRPETERLARAFVRVSAAHDTNMTPDLDQSKQISILYTDWGMAMAERPELPDQLPRIVRDILVNSAATDFHYLVQRGGRPRCFENDDGPSRPSSRYLSQLAYYGLMGHPTGLSEFDRMWREVTGSIPDHLTNPVKLTLPYEVSESKKEPLDYVLREIIFVHTVHYPGDAAMLPSSWRQPDINT